MGGIEFIVYDVDSVWLVHIVSPVRIYSLCLLSRRSSEAECHIYVLPVQDAGDFFFLRSDQYPFSR